MSIKVDPKLLAAAVEGLGLDVPIRSARVLDDGRVLVETRDGRHVWDPPKKKTAPESVSVPRVTRKRAPRAKKAGGKDGIDD